MLLWAALQSGLRYCRVICVTSAPGSIVNESMSTETLEVTTVHTLWLSSLSRLPRAVPPAHGEGPHSSSERSLAINSATVSSLRESIFSGGLSASWRSRRLRVSSCGTSAFRLSR